MLHVVNPSYQNLSKSLQKQPVRNMCMSVYMYMYMYMYVCVCTSVFNKLIWSPKKFLFGTIHFSLWARWQYVFPMARTLTLVEPTLVGTCTTVHVYVCTYTCRVSWVQIPPEPTHFHFFICLRCLSFFSFFLSFHLEYVCITRVHLQVCA